MQQPVANQSAVQRKTIPQRFQEEFKTTYERMLRSEVFDINRIDPKDARIWRKLALKAMVYLNPFQAGFKGSDYGSILAAAKGEKVMDMFSFSVISNNLDARCAKELNISCEAYAANTITSGILVEQWNLQNTPLMAKATELAKTEIERQAAEEKLQEEKEKTPTSLNGKTVNMNALKPE